MGAKGGAKVRVSDYYMSLHLGICTSGRTLQLLNIKIGEKIAWEGNLSLNNVVRVDKPSLFGGNKKEGGTKGLLWWLNGNANQRLPATLANRMGMTIDNCPGFRGLASIFLSGIKVQDSEGIQFQFPNFVNAVNGLEELDPDFLALNLRTLVNQRAGFLLGSNNPYLKTISARARRAPEGLGPAYALIRLPDSSTGREQYAANPAHIIFESMTDRDWGMGESYGAFNIASFEGCAQTLYNENFGMNILWTRQSKIQDFIKEVLDHVQGAIFVDPSTGKHTMKLLRADYDADNLPQINVDNARLSNFKRKVWGELSNEVVVTWTNPETGKEDTVTAQDNAAIAAQGGISSTSRNYHGIASQALAQQVAERDLAAVVHPIATCDAEVTREFWRSIPFGVVEVHWPEKGVERAIYRISNVKGSQSSRTVTLSLYEDVFSLGLANYMSPAESGWQNPSTVPTPLDNVYIGTAPAFMTAAVMELDDPGQIAYPEAITLLVAPPDTSDDVGYELVTYRSNSVGEVSRVSLGDRSPSGTWLLDSDLPAQARSTFMTPDVLGITPRPGDFILIGTTDATSEIAVLRSITGTNFVVDRGVMDTVPKAWPAGTRAYLIPASSVAPDPSPRSAFEQARYHLLTQTSIGTLPIQDAPEISVTLTERPHRPLRPANFRVGGVAFGTFAFPAGASSISLTWANRNREDESSQVMLWTDPTVTPEAGQVTRLVVRNAVTGVQLNMIDGLTGTGYTFARGDLAGGTDVTITAMSVRNGRVSLQGHAIRVTA